MRNIDRWLDIVGDWQFDIFADNARKWFRVKPEDEGFKRYRQAAKVLTMCALEELSVVETQERIEKHGGVALVSTDVEHFIEQFRTDYPELF